MVEEFDPVYTIVYGCNSPPRFTQQPVGSEEDRALIVYLPNEFCDSRKMNEEPIPQRRFPKNPAVGDRARTNGAAWVLLQVLIHARRLNPDLGKILADGAPASREIRTGGMGGFTWRLAGLVRY